MACETRLRLNQTPQERKAEVKRSVDALAKALAMGSIKAVVGKQGAVSFAGWNNNRDDVTDACAYRQIMISGSSLAKAAIARAEQIAGRSINREAMAQGHHSHDGGKTWDRH